MGLFPMIRSKRSAEGADIASLIGEYVTLKKGGKNYLGSVPFTGRNSILYGEP